MAGLDAAHFSTALPRYAEALGLALSPAQGTQINFRQGEFVFGKESIERRHRLTSVGLVSLILLGLIGGDFYLHYHQKEKKFQALKQELRSEFTKTFPQTKNVSNEVEQTRAAISYSDADEHRQGGIPLTGPEHAGLSDADLLAEARREAQRARLPEDSEIEIGEWTAE